MIFNERLKELRTEKGLTQVQAAEAISIAYRNYQRLEADGNLPNFSNFVRSPTCLRFRWTIWPAVPTCGRLTAAPSPRRSTRSCWRPRWTSRRGRRTCSAG